MVNIIEKEFVVSSTEIARRKRAFATLEISLLVGLVLALNRVIVEQPFIALTGICIFAFLLTVAFIMVTRFFRKFSKMKLLLDEKYLQRKSVKGDEKFLLSDIKIIDIKRTTRKTIREIKLIFSDGGIVFVNGLEHFEEFRQGIIDHSCNKVAIKEYQEPFDFDHPLFYLILGLFISISSVYITKYLLTLGTKVMKIVTVVLFIYIFAVVIFLATQKPVSKRYGNRAKR